MNKQDKQESTLGNKQAINLTSMSLIQDELMNTIEAASTHLETFISDRHNIKVLEDCTNALQQIRGSLELIQLYGASELAGEILTTASNLDTENPDTLDDKLSALTKGFFVLSCYFEYTQQHQVGMPVLLIPYINDIRLVNRQPLLAESYFEQGEGSYRRPLVPVQTTLNNEDIQQSIRRYRHMYQVGLLGVIKETEVAASLQLMHRAISKVSQLAKGSESDTLWWLAAHTLDAFIQGGMAITVTRKRVFSLLDKELKAIAKKGMVAFETSPLDSMLKDFAYYVAISGVDNSVFQQVTQSYHLEEVGYTDAVLQKEAAALTGPNANTVQSVVDVLRIELNVVKENIEQSQNRDDESGDNCEDTITRIQKIREILNIVGLTSSVKILDEPLVKLKAIHEGDTPLEEANKLDIVNALLYVESVVNSLEKGNFSGEKLAELNELTQSEMISTNHLHDTQLVVIDEAKNGLTIIKNALTAFSDTNFDSSNLTDIPEVLDELRGGMTILNLPRAAAIVEASKTFIQESLMSTHEVAALDHMLETFADALICLEYYLDCMKVDSNVSADTLVIAEESLVALGYTLKRT